MTTIQQAKIPHIVRIEGISGGEPILAGTRVTVRHVATLYLRGETLSEMADALNITEAQAIHALSYYCDHREEIETLIAEEEAAHTGYVRT